ncbi:MAG TPA: adenylate/guanylate cyclase domain-containing protein [Bryobacteraceae bacterium]|nr:adenylate/guanylate cyclase domain-containing protein [Bryobacteraceae bacterium]
MSPQSAESATAHYDFDGSAYLVAPRPANETERLASLRSLELLDTPAEERFDVLTRLASRLFQVPISYVALVEDERQWFKSRVGLQDCQTSRQVAFCSHTILRSEPLIIADTFEDPRFANNPLVTGEPHVRAYAGVPLRGPGGHNVGTLCLADHQPRQFTAHDVEVLKEMGLLVEREFQSQTVIRQQQEKLRLQEMLIESQREKDRLNSELRREKERAESFLYSLMPAEIAEEWQLNGRIEPRYFPDVTVLFTDFVGFSAAAERLAAEELVSMLNGYFTAFDQLATVYGMEKLKTIGDSYMCVGGLPAVNCSHPVDAVLTAISMRQAIRAFLEDNPLALSIRIGIHTGPVVAGVVGVHKFAYDVWGDTVNCASRMESCGAPDCINISERTFARVKDFFACESRGRVTTKEGKEVEMYFVQDVQPSLLGQTESGVPRGFQRRYRTYFRKDLKSFPMLGDAGNSPKTGLM